VQISLRAAATCGKTRRNPGILLVKSLRYNMWWLSLDRHYQQEYCAIHKGDVNAFGNEGDARKEG